MPPTLVGSNWTRSEQVSSPCSTAPGAQSPDCAGACPNSPVTSTLVIVTSSVPELMTVAACGVVGPSSTSREPALMLDTSRVTSV